MPVINGADVNFVQDSSYTLPPLQRQHDGLSMLPIYGQPLNAPHTPTTTVSSNSVPVDNERYQYMSGQSAFGSYHQLFQFYNTSLPMMPPSSVAMFPPQTIAPSSATSNNWLVPVRPMTSAPLLHTQHAMHPSQPTISSGYGLQNLIPDPDTPTTHVVGLQGRRGVLPTAPRQPPATAKNADGKFQCSECTKSYLTTRYLKRHFLRHTGNRPFVCVLCKRDFTRSDILKKHFLLCSIRCGNPAGANHLSARPQLMKSSSRSAVEEMLRNNGVNSIPVESNVRTPI